jgi:hypothetical protein
MKKLLVIIFCFLSFSHFAFSDRIRYRNTVNITIESENYKVEHYHDWSRNYAYIECINKKTNIAVFRVSSPALTNLFISHDERYIVGLSNIKIDNPYQLVILTIEGEYIKKRQISTLEARLNQNELINFSRRFFGQYKYLEVMDRVYNIGIYYYIDFKDHYFHGFYGFIGEEAWLYLCSYLSRNHLSDNFSESVTNYIYWFNESSTGLEYIYENNKLLGISLLDKKNIRITIRIDE